MKPPTDVAIVGAGPYALSLGAHLRYARVDHRIFGHPMDLWRNHMPEGMLLKSDGFASNLDNPAQLYSLSDFCGAHDIAYDDKAIPVQLATFVDYGMEFQRRFVPDLEEQLVTSIHKDGSGFQLTLDDGSTFRANRVVVAVGVGYFQFIPTILAHISPDFVSHSYASGSLSRFVGRRTVVVGGGASALDLAGLLNERGSEVQLVCRREKLLFGDTPEPGKRSLLDNLLYPSSGLGQGWRSRLCTDAPLILHAMPERFRFGVVRRHLGPAASWRTREKVVDRFPIFAGHEIVSAAVKQGKVELTIRAEGSAPVVIHADHIVSATGYRVDLRRLNILSSDLLTKISSVEHTPILSRHFESSVEGLFFTGLASANSFGPLLRFAFGARFAARRLSRYIAGRSLYRKPGFLKNAEHFDSQSSEEQRT